jgi:murein DD-endopeptidase MepM/ murein hydrolase activator NlpD
VVRPGDTISEIAYRFGLHTGTILSMNPINDVRRLLPGTRLSIPDRDGLFHGVQPGESLQSIATRYKLPLYSILDANNLDTDVVQVGDTLFIPGARMPDDQFLLAIGELLSWPVINYRFTSGYGMRSDPITRVWRLHTGIDLANAIGTPVVAAGPGRVVHRETNSPSGYGHVLILDHGNGVRTLYAHLDSFAVSVGQWVNRGQVIGRMGNTGRSTGPHLHFSVSRDGRWEDPMRHLRR